MRRSTSIPLPRLIGLGLVLVLAGTACGLHDEPAATTYGTQVTDAPRFMQGSGGPRLGERRVTPADARKQQAQADPIRIVPEALPKPADQLGFVWPVGSESQIASPFGWRIDPFDRDRSFHHGIDVGCWQGQQIMAANGGQVIWAGRARLYGYTAVVSHGYGLMTVYAHMEKDLLATVGQPIERGQIVGTCGSTGRSTGPHLHFEIRHGNTVYDPLAFLP